MFTITSSRTGAKQTIFNYVELSYHQVLSSSFFLKSCLAHLRFNFGICNSVLFCFLSFCYIFLLKKLSRLSHSVSCFLCMIKFFKFWSICVLWLSLCEVKIWSVIIQQHSTTRKKKKIAYFLFCWFLHQLISLSLQCYWETKRYHDLYDHRVAEAICMIYRWLSSLFFLSPRGDVSLNFVIRLSYTLNRSWNTLVGYLKS